MNDEARRSPRDAAEPTGFRVTDDVRQQLTIAQGFLRLRTLQAVLDTAVEHYLRHLRDSAPGFEDAVRAAARYDSTEPPRLVPLPTPPKIRKSAAKRPRPPKDRA